MAKNICDTSPQGRMGSQAISGTGSAGQNLNNPGDVRSPNVPRGGAINVPISSAGSNPKTRQNEQTKNGPSFSFKSNRY